MTRQFWTDLAERALWTFLQSFIGVVTAVPLVEVFADGIDITRAQTLLMSGAVAGISAVLSLLKGVAASRLQTLGTPQLAPGGPTYTHHDDDADSPDNRFEFDA